MASLSTLAGVFLTGVVAGFWILVAVCAACERDPACERRRRGGRPPMRTF